MNTRKSLYDVASFYKKGAVLKASYEGMRYQVERIERENGNFLKASVWPEPFCYEKTPEENIEAKEFAYSEDGLDEVYQWICEKYTQEKERWEHARDFPLDGIISY